MGCHSGLAVSDAVIGGGAVADDLAAAMTAPRCGLPRGDRFRVRRPDQRRVAGTPDDDLRQRTRRVRLLGDAVRNAKQRYFGSQGLYGAYDEKALSSTILYGLPMFAVGTERPVRSEPPTETALPIPGTFGLSSVAFDEDFTFTARSGATGRWFEADLGTGAQLPQITAGRPVQPRADTDVTAIRPDSSLLPAHGAVVSGLATGSTVTNFDAAFSRPTLDNAAGEPEPVNGVAAFPTRLAGVTTVSDERGPIGPDGVAQRQQLVLIPGQFLASPADLPGRGTQMLFDEMAGDVYYSPSTDWTLPTVGEVSLGRVVGEDSARVSIDAEDASGIHRVVALFQAAGQDWESVDLAPSDGSFGGSLPVPEAITNDQIRVIVQVVDGAGNVAWASDKGPGFAPLTPPPVPPTVTSTPVAPATGWHAQVPTITVSGTPSVTYTVSIDGAVPVPYAAPFTPAGLPDGTHVIEVAGTDGSRTFHTINVDAVAPSIAMVTTPAANGAGWNNTPVTATFACTDSMSGIDVCPRPSRPALRRGPACRSSGSPRIVRVPRPRPVGRSRSTAPHRRDPRSSSVR